MDSLPLDLITHHIFGFLTLPDLAICRLVSKKWNKSKFPFFHQFIDTVATTDVIWEQVSTHFFGIKSKAKQIGDKQITSWMSQCIALRTSPSVDVPLELVSSDGGEYSGWYGPGNLISKNYDRVYCSGVKGRNVNIIFTLKSEMLLKAFQIVSPTWGFTAPVSRGLIFLSDTLPKVEDFASFDQLPLESLQSIANGTYKTNNFISPAGAFYDCATAKFNGKFYPHAFGKYILLKLYLVSNTENIDIQKFYVYGIPISL